MKRLLEFLALCTAASASVQAAAPITLGLSYPRTGSYKEEGLAQMRGAMLAIDELNAQGGVVRRSLSLSSLNDASKADKAVRNVDKLAKEGAAMLFGGASSAATIAAGKRAAQLGLLYFGTLTYSNDTTGKDGHRYMFRECNNAWMSARVLGQYLNKQLPDKRYFYVMADYTWGHTTESSLRQTTSTQYAARHPGLKVPFPGAGLADYQNALTQAAASNADVLALVLFGEDLVRAMRIAKDLGLTSRMQIVAPNLTQSIVEQAGPDGRPGRHRTLDMARAETGELGAWQSLRQGLQRTLRLVHVQLGCVGLQHRSAMGGCGQARRQFGQRGADQGTGRPQLRPAQGSPAMAQLRSPEHPDRVRGEGETSRRGTQGPAQAGLLRHRRASGWQHRAGRSDHLADRAA